MALTQCEQYEPFWSAHRDNWRPCTPDDVHGLREDRTFHPPSKAHRKRLARARPEVTPVVPRPVLDNSRRRQINQAQAVAKAVHAALKANGGLNV